MHALECIRIRSRSTKPRTKGTTTIYDFGHYGLAATEDLLQGSGEYIDFAKLFVTTIRFQKEEFVREKIRLYQRHDVHPVPGGLFLETALAQNKVAEYLEGIKELGLEFVEVSDNVTEMPIEQQAGLVAEAVRRGLRVIGEVGKKFPTHPISPEETIADARRLMDAGAEKVLVERHEIMHIAGEEGENAEALRDVLVRIVEGIGLEKTIYEARHETIQCRLIENISPETCMGNIEPEQALRLEMARCGFHRGLKFQAVLEAPEAAG